MQARADANGIELVLKDCPLEHPQGLPLPRASWLPRGPGPECTLGTTRSELEARWKIALPTPAKNAPITLRASDKSPFDFYLVYLDGGDRVTKIDARHRHTGEALKLPQAASKAMTSGWTMQAQAFGWPWQQGFRQGNLQSWSTYDEETQVRVSGRITATAD